MEELIPEGSEFYLKSTQKTYHLRPCTVADEIWIKKNAAQFKNDSELEQACKYAFRLMTDEDKKEFIAQEVTIIDDLGETAKVKMGGWILLMNLISGSKEKEAVGEAVLKAIGVSRQAIEEMNEQSQKKSESLNPSKTGEKSSISSAPNMDGPQNTSSPAPLKKLERESTISGSENMGNSPKAS